MIRWDRLACVEIVLLHMSHMSLCFDVQVATPFIHTANQQHQQIYRGPKQTVLACLPPFMAVGSSLLLAISFSSSPSVPEVSPCFFSLGLGAFHSFHFHKVGVPNGPFYLQFAFTFLRICDGVPCALAAEKLWAWHLLCIFTCMKCSTKIRSQTTNICDKPCLFQWVLCESKPSNHGRVCWPMSELNFLDAYLVVALVPHALQCSWHMSHAFSCPTQHQQS